MQASFKIIETENDIIQNWFNQLDKLVTPTHETTRTDITFLDTLEKAITVEFMKTVGVDFLLGPIYDRILYQYTTVAGNIQLYARLNSEERNIFNTRAMRILTNIIEMINNHFMAQFTT